MKNWTLSHWIGGFSAAFGATALLAAGAWQTMAAVLPTPDAALGLLLGAPAFFYESRPRVGRVAGGLLAALGLAGAVLGVFADSLAHFSLMPWHLALGFFTSGSILASMHSIKNKWTAWLIELACLSVILLGVFHVVDQMTGLRVVNAGLSNVSSTLTAALLSLLGLGLWFLIRRTPWYQEFDISRIDWKITAVSGMILLLIAFAAAVASFVIMAGQAERTMKDSLALSWGNRARLFQNEINDALRAATGISQRSSIRDAVGRFSSGEESPADRARIVGIVTRLLNGRYADISAAALYDARGRLLTRAGRFVAGSELKVPIPLAQPAVLLWDQGLVLQMKLNMVEGDRLLGVLMVDIRLTGIDAMLQDRAGLGATGVALVCAAVGPDLHCVRAQQDYRLAKAPRHREGDPLAMTYALAGKSGVGGVVDYRGKEVVSAYGPIGAWGLGMVVKIEKAEMQQPIRKRLRGMLAALAVLALVGLVLLRWQAAPLIQRLLEEIAERRRAEQESRLLQAVALEIDQPNDLHAVLDVVLRKLGEATGWVLGQAWIPAADGTHLWCSPAWYGAPAVEKYHATSLPLKLLPGKGLPTRVWASRQPVWVPDVRVLIAPWSKRFPLANELNLKTWMGIPVMVDGALVAVLEFLTTSMRPEDERLINLANSVAAQLGLVIQRRRVQEALRESEARHRALAANSVEAIYFFDQETKRVVECNSAFTRLTGYTEQEALGLTIYDFVDYPQSDVDAFVAQISDSEAISDEERVWRRKDGSLVDVQVTAGKIRSQGGDLGFFIARDISRRKQHEAEIAEGRRKYQELLESLDAIVWQADPDSFRFTYVSPQAERILGYPARDWLEQQTFWRDHLHPEDRDRAVAYCVEATVAGRDHEFEYRMLAADGRVLWFRDKVTVVKQDGRPVQLRGILFDITNTKHAGQELLDSEERYRTFIHNSVEAIYFYDLETKQVLETNPAFQKMLGYSAEEVHNLSMHSFIQHDKQSIHNFSQRIVDSGSGFSIGERTWRAKDGTPKHVQVTVGRIKQKDRMTGFAIARDVTEQKRAQERLNYLAHFDELTGLPNRAFFHENLHQILIDAARRRRLAAVMFLDLDRFKTINDTLGHEAGDDLLKAVADRLRNCVRRGDVVARLGGDEFTVGLADVAQSEDVVLVAQKILESFAHPFLISGRDLFVTTSIGIALYPDDHQDVEGLLKNADAAMYRAKEQGRNNYQFYTQEMNEKAFERLTLEIQLRRALDRQELFLHYQPQVDLVKGTVVGMEALLRWQNPELGLVSPATFIPLAEETGLIVPIGEWVLRAACSQNKAWQDAGLPRLRISVNLSGRQFREKDLVETVRKVLAETGLAPKYLELELTESMLQHMDTAEAVLQELHALGVYLSVDDFGTGYSSFNYLKRFPIDNLKIDRSFVRDVIEDPDDAAITDAIISMAHTLGIHVVAEGVETREQLVFLHQHKCDMIQGYYFSKPLPAEAFVALLRTGRRLTPGERLIAADGKSAHG